MRAKFSNYINHGTYISIVDDAEKFASMSVTNDAENVVEYLLKNGLMKPNQKLIYKDTTGQWDELVHDGRKFIGFNILSSSSIEDASRKINVAP